MPDEASDLGVVATWPLSVVATLFEEAKEVLDQANEAFVCDRCLYVYPVTSAKAGAVRLVDDQGRAQVPEDWREKAGDYPVGGQAVVTLFCTHCYETKRREAAVAAFSKLLGSDPSSLILGSIDLSGLLGGRAQPEEDSREMPGQYL